MIAQELEVSLHMAFVEARQQRHEFITVEHLLLALLDNPSAAEVLRFRDEAFNEYFANDVYLDMVSRKFGDDTRRHIEEMASVGLRRKLLEEVAAG